MARNELLQFGVQLTVLAVGEGFPCVENSLALGQRTSDGGKLRMVGKLLPYLGQRACVYLQEPSQGGGNLLVVLVGKAALATLGKCLVEGDPGQFLRGKQACRANSPVNAPHHEDDRDEQEHGGD